MYRARPSSRARRGGSGATSGAGAGAEQLGRGRSRGGGGIGGATAAQHEHRRGPPEGSPSPPHRSRRCHPRCPGPPPAAAAEVTPSRAEEEVRTRACAGGRQCRSTVADGGGAGAAQRRPASLGRPASRDQSPDRCPKLGLQRLCSATGKASDETSVS